MPKWPFRRKVQTRIENPIESYDPHNILPRNQYLTKLTNYYIPPLNLSKYMSEQTGVGARVFDDQALQGGVAEYFSNYINDGIGPIPNLQNVYQTLRDVYQQNRREFFLGNLSWETIPPRFDKNSIKYDNRKLFLYPQVAPPPPTGDPSEDERRRNWYFGLDESLREEIVRGISASFTLEQYLNFRKNLAQKYGATYSEYETHDYTAPRPPR